MKRLASAMITLALMGCAEQRRRDGLILTDTRTGKQYLLKPAVDGAYFVHERQPLVSGNDTTYVFR